LEIEGKPFAQRISFKNINLMESKFSDRRLAKINFLMSSHIKIKTPNQCRSHHQNMMKMHKTLTGIIKFIENLECDQSQLEIKLRP
jgi:hypothetical protein